MEQKLSHNTAISASRQRKIEDCLLKKLAYIPYERITIADLCREMDISRQLFYTYFPDKESCLISLIDRILHESMDILPMPHNRNFSINKTITVYLQFWKDHSNFLDVIVKQRLKGHLIDRSYVYFSNDGNAILSYLNAPDIKSDNTLLWIYSAIRFAVIFQWHEHNFEEPLEKIADKYERLLKKPLIQDIF